MKGNWGWEWSRNWELNQWNKINLFQLPGWWKIGWNWNEMGFWCGFKL